MEEPRPPHEESLPSPEKMTSEPDKEVKPSRLAALLSQLGEAPPQPPPIQLEQLAYEQVEAVPGPSGSTPETAPEPEAPGIEVSIETIPETVAAKADARNRLEAVFEASTEAEPEEELPEEAQRERRVEIKKEPATDSALASSIGQILAELHQKTAAAHAAFSRLKKPGQGSSLAPVLAFRALPNLYKQAIIGGFASAAIFLLTAVMLFTLN